MTQFYLFTQVNHDLAG